MPARKADSDDISALTPAEAEMLRQVVKSVNASGPYADALYTEMEILVEAGWESAKDLLDLTVGFSGNPSLAMQALREYVNKFSVLVVEREQKALLDAIDQGLADGSSPSVVADALKQTFADGYHVYDDAGNLVRTMPTDAWSKMVAQTELSRAQTMGNLDLYKAAQIEKVMFVTNQGETVCDECEPLDGEIIEIDDLDDDDTPPLHPNCCCALVAADADVNEQAA